MKLGSFFILCLYVIDSYMIDVQRCINKCLQDSGGKKKGKSQKKKSKNNKNSQRKSNCKKLNLPLGGNDLTQKLYSTMEKHKEVSFVVTQLMSFKNGDSKEMRLYYILPDNPKRIIRNKNIHAY